MWKLGLREAKWDHPWARIRTEDKYSVIHYRAQSQTIYIIPNAS